MHKGTVKMCYLTFLLMCIHVTILKTSELDVCNNTKSKIKCCASYPDNDKKCEDCLVGPHGKYCSEICTLKYFGKACSEVCYCPTDKICHNSEECIDKPETLKDIFDKCTINGKDSSECCVNQRRVGEKCLDCWTGTFGENCKHNCPTGRYGRFCLEKCKCNPDETCHRIIGCSKCVVETYGEICIDEDPYALKADYDNCTKNTNRNASSKCCVNQRKNGEECEDCWIGTFGENCEHKCPSGRYGRFCLENCTCNPDETCHRVTGCSCNYFHFIVLLILINAMYVKINTSIHQHENYSYADNLPNNPYLDFQFL